MQFDQKIDIFVLFSSYVMFEEHFSTVDYLLLDRMKYFAKLTLKQGIHLLNSTFMFIYNEYLKLHKTYVNF